MKKAIFTLTMIFASLIVSAQDKYLTVVHLGNGVVEVTNHQKCAVDIAIQNDGVITKLNPNRGNSVTSYKVPAGTSTFSFTGVGLTYIKLKALSICEWKGDSPTWVNVPLPVNALPVKIMNLRSKLIIIN